MPEVLFLNPRRGHRRKAKATRRRRGTHRRRRAHARVRRHNPVMNLRRRRPRRRVHARRMHRRRRNPAFRMGGVMQTFTQGAGIAAGGVAVEVLANKLAAMIPAGWKLDANVARIGTKAALTIVVPLIARNVKVLPRGVVNAIAIGGAVVTVVDIIRTYVVPNVPFLQGYEPGVLSAYEPGMLSEYDQGGGVSGAGAFGDGAF